MSFNLTGNCCYIHAHMCKILVFLALVTGVAQAQQVAHRYTAAKDSANFYMRGKQYDKALANFKMSFEQGNINMYDYYNAACAAALTQRPDEAFALLDKAMDRGYMDKPWAEMDSDFNSLHNDNRWTLALRRLADQPRLVLQKFAAIKGKDPATLIPFKQDGAWGYLDKTTLDVVVAPEFDALSFINGCAEVSCFDGTRFWINPSVQLEDISYRDHSDPEFAIAMDDSDQQGPFPISSANGFKGFKMDEEKQITHFSDIYNRMQPHFFNIRGPFVINGKYYAVAEKGDASGVIDEEGNSLPGFDFIHDQLVYNSAATGGDTWFYYEAKDGTKGFINHKGKKKLAGELVDYPFSSINLFDFGVQRNNEVSGVIDLQKMEWVIKPQPLFIQRIYGTTNAACKNYTSKRKDMIDVYFRVIKAGAEPDEYYIDRKMRVYKPKK